MIIKKTAIVTSDYAPNTGGIAAYWKNLYKHLPKNKFILIAPKSHEFLDEVIQIDFYFRYFWPRWFKLFLELRKIIKSEKIHSVIAGQILPVGTVCFILCKLGYLPSYQISCHGMDLAILRGRKKFFAGIFLRKADRVIVNSEMTKKLALSFCVEEKKIILVKPCPDIVADSNDDIKKILNIKTDNIIISLGRLVERKGFDRVIASLPEVWKGVPDLVYLILGDGEYRESLKNLVQTIIPKDKQNQIFFLGKVSDREKVNYMKAAKIFVLPTRDIGGDKEGFGMVNLEAGIFGLPVIAGKISGETGSVVDKKTGFLVNPNSSSEIASKIKELLTDSDKMYKMGQANRSFALSFDWKKEAEILNNNI